MGLAQIAIIVQLVFGIIIGLYFWNLLKGQRNSKVTIDRESRKEMEELRRMRSISLSEPLAERIRPKGFEDIVGQEDGIKSLKAALCGPNPQHVIIYGPPGVGKTAAARLVLEEAKKISHTSFRREAVFIELDATTARFDERGIADPLIGSVHDPIYQGAGSLGQAGVPQPKKGAVSDAHGGILFIDEIGELHPIQMNKLLKVLEDRKVKFESAYYSEENMNIPNYIHDIFKNGMPADFRLVGATTRMSHEIPEAIRSRCVEIFFRSLTTEELRIVIKKAADKLELGLSEENASKIAQYARNGREAINLVQIAASLTIMDEEKTIRDEHIEWVINSSQLVPKMERQVRTVPRAGIVNGLAVSGPTSGSLLEIEVTAMPAKGEHGNIIITGIVEEESIGGQGKSIRRKSMAKGSVENVLTVLRSLGEIEKEYDIHINFPGGTPIDGPSAGIAMATAIRSAVSKVPVYPDLAMTGEISILGEVKPVGGVYTKCTAAKIAGVKRVIIPRDNEQRVLHTIEGIEIIPVDTIEEVFQLAFPTAAKLREDTNWEELRNEETGS